MAKQHEIEAKKAQLIDSYGPDGLAQMVIDLTEELEAKTPKAVPDGWSDLVSDLACALYAAVNAGRLDEEDVINYQNDQIKTTVGSLLDRANEMLTDHPGPSTTACDDQEAPDE